MKIGKIFEYSDYEKYPKIHAERDRQEQRSRQRKMTGCVSSLHCTQMKWKQKCIFWPHVWTTHRPGTLLYQFHIPPKKLPSESVQGQTLLPARWNSSKLKTGCKLHNMWSHDITKGQPARTTKKNHIYLSYECVCNLNYIWRDKKKCTA